MVLAFQKSRSPKQRGIRIALGALIVFAIALSIMVAADLDKERRPSSSFPAFLAGRFTPHLAIAEAAAAQRRGDPRRAERLAIDVLEVEPSNQAALRTLGEIAFKRGDREVAEQWYLLAATQGWRDGLTQLYWYQRALELSDFNTATQRAEALLRIRWDDAYVSRRLAELEASEEGRSALAARMAAVSDWPTAGLANTTGLSDDGLRNRISTLLKALDAGATLPGKVVYDVASQALAHGLAPEGRMLSTRALLPADAGKLVSDGDFEAGDAGLGAPFGWRLTRQSAFSVSIGHGNGSPGTALHIRSSGPGRATVVRQRLVLTTGQYLISWKQAGQGLHITPRIDCKGGPAITLHPRSASNDLFAFSLPPALPCSSQDLALVATGSESGLESSIDDITLVALPS